MRVLIICRDNIGDTLLTTPLISALAQSGQHQVDVLTNNYAAPVLQHNPDIRQLFYYTKLHHREAGQSRLACVLQRLKLMLTLKKQRYDAVILAKSRWDQHGMKWVKTVRPTRVIALGEQSHPLITDLLPPPGKSPCHISETLFSLGRPFSLSAIAPGKLTLLPDTAIAASLRDTCAIDSTVPVYALQISARKPSQQWEATRFAELAEKIATRHACQIMLLWSPGSRDNPRHPGDDEKAHEIMALCPHLPIKAVSTTSLPQLIAAMSLCQGLVSSDGGAMHMGAALGLPVVALFGDSDPACWHPWQVTCQVLQPASREVNALSSREVYDAFVQTIIP
ncbi:MULTISPECIES: glycosyltransferase family 9 protein [unclassified Pantoea]|uniref:glycosyltransferase family 9 protein n=1 Tax=unclassified Pantoea TaxID=2630326 RepID=UPI0023DC046F|nr:MULTISPECIES: glycosyltransferase family 9 protein [unclassified Pantoea]MDF2042998.1 glycosyltransferase family 9 protein [Pantoea sp. Cr_R14]MDF2069456.1 glycosyltransferase family 9 protein [Pantoea sp. Cr_R13]MDF2080022.1 glycosyltransferase family 9 protein [Pantoea sp. Cr_R21]